MRISRRTTIIVASVLAGIASAMLLGPQLAIDATRTKRGFEAAASEVLGLRVSVDGRFAVAFTGDVLFVMRDVRARGADGTEVLKVDRATVALGLIPLLLDRPQVRRIELTRPTIAVALDQEEKAIGAPPPERRRGRSALEGARLSVEDGSVYYRDRALGAVLHATGVNADGSVRDRHLVLDPITMRLLGADGRGTFHADLSDSVPRFSLRATFPRVQLTECLRLISPDTIATGAVELALTLSSRGRTPGERIRNLRGEVVLMGREILLPHYDLDAELSRFAASQNLDLMDMGSVLLVGPLGMVVTKGFDFARLLGDSDGSTRISAIVSAWDVRNGVLHARDVAMATGKHRLALTGRLDFVSQRFDGVSVALVDEDGCAKIRQELRGTFREPELTKPSVLTALLGPARSLVTKAKDILPGSCAEFYSGSIPAPSG